jgi:uncharacterized protein YbaR (Trm112 family)
MSAAERSAERDVERTVAALQVLRERGALRTIPRRIQAALRCPACQARLTVTQERLTCVECGRRYPQVGDTPVLLEEAATAET